MRYNIVAAGRDMMLHRVQKMNSRGASMSTHRVQGVCKSKEERWALSVRWIDGNQGDLLWYRIK